MIKCIKFLILFLVILILPLLIYLHSTNISLQTQIEKNKQLKEQIIYLDKFKTDVNTMSLMNNYYIISNDYSYNSSYENAYKSANDSLNTLYEKKYISLDNKTELEHYLLKFNNSVDKMNNSTNDPQYKKEKLLEFSSLENQIINTTSYNLKNNIQNSEANSANALNIVNNQNNIIEVIGGFFSIIFLTPIYYLGKNLNIVNDAVKNFFNNIKNKNQTIPKNNYTNEENCNSEMLQCINNGILKNLNDKISEREIMVSTLKMIYSHSQFMAKEYEHSYIILKSIELELLDLKAELNKLLDKSEIPYEKLNIIENKFLETRFILERLPQYNDFIVKLTEKY